MIIFVHIWAYNLKKGKDIFIISIIYCICILVFNIFVFLGGVTRFVHIQDRIVVGILYNPVSGLLCIV